MKALRNLASFDDEELECTTTPYVVPRRAKSDCVICDPSTDAADYLETVKVGIAGIPLCIVHVNMVVTSAEVGYVNDGEDWTVREGAFERCVRVVLRMKLEQSGARLIAWRRK